MRIRELQREDLPQVASLVELAFRSGSREPAAGLASYLDRLLFGHPWVDPEIPSLVSIDDRDQVVAFLGSHVRRFRFDGRPIRIAVAGQLVADPAARQRATGAFLLKRYLEGPQDATFTDTASAMVQRMWRGFGGSAIDLERIGWLRLFSPFRFAGVYGLRNHPRSMRAAVALSTPIDGLIAVIARRYLAAPRPDVQTEALAPSSLIEHLPTVGSFARLLPDYDEAFLRWIFDELAQVTSRGHLTGSLVRGRSGDLLGWYLYFLRRGGVSQVLQIVGNERTTPVVIDHLFFHALANGSAAIQGRLEPQLVEPIAARHCILHPSGYRVLLHAHDRTIIHSVHEGTALLSRLDGDWWTGLGREPYAVGETVSPDLR